MEIQWLNEYKKIMMLASRVNYLESFDSANDTIRSTYDHWQATYSFFIDCVYDAEKRNKQKDNS